MIPATITNRSLERASAIALAGQLASRAGSFDTGWGRIYPPSRTNSCGGGVTRNDRRGGTRDNGQMR